MTPSSACEWQKGALGKIEKKLLDGCEPWASELEQRRDGSAQTQHYIREFGCMLQCEARALGIDVNSDMDWMLWISYDENGESIICQNVRTEDGKPIGWLEETLVTKGRPVRLKDEHGVTTELPGYDVVKEPTLAPPIRKKYGKAKGEKILAFLLRMHTEYLDYPGTGCVCHTASITSQPLRYAPSPLSADMSMCARMLCFASRLGLEEAVAQEWEARAEKG